MANWFSSLFGSKKKKDTIEDHRRKYYDSVRSQAPVRSLAGGYGSANVAPDPSSDLLNPLNPLSPISPFGIYQSNMDDTPTHQSSSDYSTPSHSNDNHSSHSYDSGSSYDIGSSSSDSSSYSDSSSSSFD